MIADTAEAYRGLASFQDTPSDRLLFFGRDKEAQSLLDLVLSEPLVVLFARSGMGKTSLINAGLLQSLRDRQFFPVVVRLTNDPDGDPVKSVIQAVKAACKATGVDCVGCLSETTLWGFFHHACFSLHGQALRAVLVIDQFEELFTRLSRRAQFLSGLADLVRRRIPEEVVAAETLRLKDLPVEAPERQSIVSLLYGEAGPDIKVLLSLREDYLPELEGLRSLLPMILRTNTTLRLEPLSIEQAQDAIVKPGKTAEVLSNETFTFAPGVVDEMLDFLRSKQVDGERILGEVIDPPQLQILCWHLDQARRERNSPMITSADLGGRQGMERILAGHYQGLLHRFSIVRAGWNARKRRPSTQNLLLFCRPRAAVRRLCERGLITRGEQRNSLMGDVIRDEYGVDSADLEKLVATRLLRSESRLEKQFFELSHDTLIGPIRAHRRSRLRTAWIASTAFLVLLAVSLPVLRAASTSYERARVGNAQSDEDRLALVKALLRAGGSDFSDFNLSHLDLSRLLRAADMPSSDWSHANLRGAKLGSINQISSRWVGANLAHADLSLAFVPDSDFTDAQMQGAGCPGAEFRNSKLVRVDASDADFSLSDLSRADLSNAHLERATFAGAELRGAQMYGAIIDSHTDFRKTAWWLAEGWSPASLPLMLAQSSPETLTSTHAYRHGLELLDHAVEHSSYSRERSMALNNRAWYRAIRGTDLEYAFGDAQEALRLAPMEPHFLDTRGYICLRQGRKHEALADCEESVRRLRDLGVGESIYHLGLARESLGEWQSAREAFDKSRRSGYRPTYELLLTPRVDPQGLVGRFSGPATGVPLRSPAARASSGSPSRGKPLPP